MHENSPKSLWMSEQKYGLVLEFPFEFIAHISVELRVWCRSKIDCCYWRFFPDTKTRAYCQVCRCRSIHWGSCLNLITGACEERPDPATTKHVCTCVDLTCALMHACHTVLHFPVYLFWHTNTAANACCLQTEQAHGMGACSTYLHVIPGTCNGSV